MNLTRFALRNRVFVLCVVGALFVAGLLNFLTMPRREDPEINIRTAVVTTSWPGATALKIEDLVTDPIETSIKRMDGVDEIRSESRNGQSIIYVDLVDETPGDAVDQYWDQLRVKVAEAEPKLPSGCGKPFVNADFGDVYDIVFALYQNAPPGGGITREYSMRDLEVFAELVQDETKNLPTVGRVDLFGVQDERIYLEVDAADWAKLELTSDDLQQILESRNIVASGGQIDTKTSRYNVKPTGEFKSIDEIREVFVRFVDGDVPVRLGDLPIDIVRDYVDPPSQFTMVRTPTINAERSLMIGVSLKSGNNIVAMGEDVAARIEGLKATTLPPDLVLKRVNDLPVKVDTLVKDFVVNLLQAIALVLVVAFLMMGWRAATVMAAAIPLCMIIAIFVVSLMGVELEQFSIASLIIALGMLVDNAIVVSDNVLREYEEKGAGSKEKREKGALEGAWSLAIPILTSTLTTVGAFLPMLTIIGNTGEYVSSLPIVVSVTLLTSYFIAMMVTPIFCMWILKPGEAKEKKAGITTRLLAALFAPFKRKKAAAPATTEPPAESAAADNGFYDKAIQWCLGHKLIAIGGSLAAVVLSLQLVPFIGSEFFPGGVRDQVWAHVWLPEGSSLEATAGKTREVLDKLVELSPHEVDGETVERLDTATAFVGFGGPRLNLVSSPEQRLPNYALVLITTTDANLSFDYAVELAEAAQSIAGVRIDIRPFKLGPYVKTPVEFRIVGTDHDVLRAKANEGVAIMRASPGVAEPYHNWFNDGFVYEIEVDPEKANLARVTNLSVAQTMDSLISGGYLTTLREGDHQVPVVLRIRRDQREAVLDDVSDVYVDGYAGKVPLESLAEISTTWEPACVQRKDTIRSISVGGTAKPGYLANSLMADLRPQFEALLEGLPPEYKLEDAGELEQTKESSEKILGAFQISGMLIVLVLIAQYNSILKPLIVLFTVPLALIGALLGLFTTGWALGFMPNLGMISLFGVVINNAIILIDFIESNLRSGMPLNEAVASAGRLRMRPIVLTTLTTIGGLLPLAMLAGPMWAGMAWAMIFGLALSTGLTLLVIPTLYALCVEKFGLKPR